MNWFRDHLLSNQLDGDFVSTAARNTLCQPFFVRHSLDHAARPSDLVLLTCKGFAADLVDQMEVLIEFMLIE